MIKKEGNRKGRTCLEISYEMFRLKNIKLFFTHPNVEPIARLLLILFVVALLCVIVYIRLCDCNLRNTKLCSIVWFNKFISFTTQIPWILDERNISCSDEIKCIVNQKSKSERPDAYLFYGPTIDKIPLPRNPKTIWGWFYDESPIDRMLFMYEESLKLFNFSATYSRNSDFPLPLNWLRGLDKLTNVQYYVNTSEKNTLLSELAPVLYMHSDCDSFTDRDLYVKTLMKYIKIDAYGDCLHNKDMPLDQAYYKNPSKSYIYRFNLYNEDIMQFVARYKFIVAIENAVCNDYITEKLWRSIELGVVPIYYGSPLIRDWLPNNKSAILLEDFPTPELLSQHLHYLLQNDTAYEEYLEHKTLRLISNKKLIDEVTMRPYQTDIEGQVKRFECFICEKLHNINDRSVNVVTKKHYECQMPTSALTLSENPNSSWVQFIKEAASTIIVLFEEINSPNEMQRVSLNSFIDLESLRRIFGTSNTLASIQKHTV